MTSDTFSSIPNFASGGWAAWSALISAVTSWLVTFLLNRYQLRDKLQVEYEYEQKKQVRQLMGRFHGRILQASAQMSLRMWNLYDNHGERWLERGGPRAGIGYYLLSTSHRFLRLISLCRQLEKEAIFLDARIAKEDDRAFLKTTSAIIFCMTDGRLFDNIDYDHSTSRDHFFADELRRTCDHCWVGEDVLDQDALREIIRSESKLEEIVTFFDGLTPNEARYRWDRMVALHLLLIGFINKFGYPEQSLNTSQILRAASKFKNDSIAENFRRWITLLGLDRENEFLLIKRCLYEVHGRQH